MTTELCDYIIDKNDPDSRCKNKATFEVYVSTVWYTDVHDICRRVCNAHIVDLIADVDECQMAHIASKKENNDTTCHHRVAK